MTPHEYKSLPKAEQQQIWHKLTNEEKRAIFEDERATPLVGSGKSGGEFKHVADYRDYLRKHTCYGGLRGLVEVVFWLTVFGGLLGGMMVMNQNVDALPGYVAWWAGALCTSGLLRSLVHAVIDGVDARLERNLRER